MYGYLPNGQVVSSEVISSNGSGHGALAGLLAGKSIDVLICGGIGGGAQAALSENGIELCAGVSGSADEAVEAYLRGELLNTARIAATMEKVTPVMTMRAAVMADVMRKRNLREETSERKSAPIIAEPLTTERSKIIAGNMTWNARNQKIIYVIDNAEKQVIERVYKLR